MGHGTRDIVPCDKVIRLAANAFVSCAKKRILTQRRLKTCVS